MKVLLLGATGRTGKWVLKGALMAGHAVHVLVRQAVKVTTSHPDLTIFEGDVANGADLAQALDGCDAAINVLNVSRTSDFPWSPLRTPERFLSEVMSLLITLASERPIRKIVSCSAWGVGDSRAEIPGWFRWFIDHSNIGVAYADHERQEKLLMAADLQWTIVRPVGLTNAAGQQVVRQSFKGNPKPNLTISRSSVAKFMVDCLVDEETIGRVITVSKQ